MRKSSLLRLLTAALLMGGVWVAYTQQQRPPAMLKTNKIANDLYEIENVGSLAGNVTVLVTDDGLIEVDDKFDPDHDAILAQIKTFSDKPVKYVISTHHHGDHTGGNAKMLAKGVQIIASEEARENMVDAKMPGIPTLAFEHHTHTSIWAARMSSCTTSAARTPMATPWCTSRHSACSPPETCSPLATPLRS